MPLNIKELTQKVYNKGKDILNKPIFAKKTISQSQQVKKEVEDTSKINIEQIKQNYLNKGFTIKEEKNGKIILVSKKQKYTYVDKWSRKTEKYFIPTKIIIDTKTGEYIEEHYSLKSISRKSGPDYQAPVKKEVIIYVNGKPSIKKRYTYYNATPKKTYEYFYDYEKNKWVLGKRSTNERALKQKVRDIKEEIDRYIEYQQSKGRKINYKYLETKFNELKRYKVVSKNFDFGTWYSQEISPYNRAINLSKRKQVITYDITDIWNKLTKNNKNFQKIKVVKQEDVVNNIKKTPNGIIKPYEPKNFFEKLKYKIVKAGETGGVVGGVLATAYYMGKEISYFPKFVFWDIPKYALYYPTKKMGEKIYSDIKTTYETGKYFIKESKDINKYSSLKDWFKEKYKQSPIELKRQERKEKLQKIYNKGKEIYKQIKEEGNVLAPIRPYTYAFGRYAKEHPAEVVGSFAGVVAAPVIIPEAIAEGSRIGRNIIVKAKSDVLISPEEVFYLEKPLKYTETNEEVIKSFEKAKTIKPNIQIEEAKVEDIIRMKPATKEDVNKLYSYRGVHLSPSEALKKSKKILPPEEARMKVKGKTPKLEDVGLYITPYGEGQTFFLYLGEGETLPEYTYNPLNLLKIKKPSTFEVYFENLKKVDRKDLEKFLKPEYKGKDIKNIKTHMIDWEKVWEWQQTLPKGTAHITIRRIAGITHEPEAIIPVGNEISLLYNKPIKKFRKYTTYTTKEGKKYNIPLYELEVLSEEKALLPENKQKVIEARRLLSKQEEELRNVREFYSKYGYVPKYKPSPTYSFGYAGRYLYMFSKQKEYYKPIEKENYSYIIKEYKGYKPYKEEYYNKKIYNFKGYKPYEPTKEIYYSTETDYNYENIGYPKYSTTYSLKVPYYPHILITKIREPPRKQIYRYPKEYKKKIIKKKTKSLKPRKYTPTIEAIFKNIVKRGSKKKLKEKTFTGFEVRPLIDNKKKKKIKIINFFRR